MHLIKASNLNISCGITPLVSYLFNVHTNNGGGGAAVLEYSVWRGFGINCLLEGLIGERIMEEDVMRNAIRKTGLLSLEMKIQICTA